MLGKKSVVVISGGEVCRFSFNSGQYQSLCTRPVLRWFPKYIARYADILLPVSNYVYTEAVQSVNANIQRMEMIHHCFDTSPFKKSQHLNKKPIAISVAIINNEALYHKRIKDFLETGKLLSDISFILIGPDRDGTSKKLRAELPPNTSIIDGLCGDDLIKYMSRAAVYVQPSSWESFGCAVAEAMLCECVPVVTRIPALEEVVGDCGVYLDDPITPQEIADKVKIALEHPELGKRARQRVVRKFPLEKRKRRLLKTLASLEL